MKWMKEGKIICVKTLENRGITLLALKEKIDIMSSAITIFNSTTTNLSLSTTYTKVPLNAFEAQSGTRLTVKAIQ